MQSELVAEAQRMGAETAKAHAEARRNEAEALRIEAEAQRADADYQRMEVERAKDGMHGPMHVHPCTCTCTLCTCRWLKKPPNAVSRMKHVVLQLRVASAIPSAKQIGRATRGEASPQLCTRRMHRRWRRMSIHCQACRAHAAKWR